MSHKIIILDLTKSLYIDACNEIYDKDGISIIKITDQLEQILEMQDIMAVIL